MLRLTAWPLYCKLVYSLTLSCLLGAAFSELLRCCLLGSESLTFPSNQITLYFQSCDEFFSPQPLVPVNLHFNR